MLTDRNILLQLEHWLFTLGHAQTKPSSAAPSKLHITIKPQHIAAAWNRREMQEQSSPLTLALAEQTTFFVGRWESPRVVELWAACLGGVLARYEAPRQLVAFMTA